jgi:hypothetical protein
LIGPVDKEPGGGALVWPDENDIVEVWNVAELVGPHPQLMVTMDGARLTVTVVLLIRPTW